MRTRTNKPQFDNLLVLLVFAIFMVSILMVLLTGADVVQNLTQRDRLSYNRRTAAQYITTRIRQADRSEAISVRTFSNQNALVFTEEFDGILYDTVIYCYDGYLREQFCERGYEQDPEFGEMILPMETFRAEQNGQTLQIGISYAEGDSQDLFFRLRSERSVTS